MHGGGGAGPKNDFDACVWVDIKYPEVISAPTESAKTRINHAIQQWVLAEVYTGDNDPPIAKNQEALIQDFIKQEKQFRAEEGEGRIDYNFGWWLDYKIKVMYESANVLSLNRDALAYTGGNGEQEAFDYTNFRPSKGEPIRLPDILKPGFEKPLSAIGEVRFRAEEHLSPKASLHGIFQFPNDRFYLTDNFFIDAKGLTFVYGTGEVSCLACRAPSIFLPYSDLRNLLRPDANIP